MLFPQILNPVLRLRELLSTNKTLFEVFFGFKVQDLWTRFLGNLELKQIL